MEFCRLVGVYFSLPESCKKKEKHAKMATRKPFVSLAFDESRDDNSCAKIVHDTDRSSKINPLEGANSIFSLIKTKFSMKKVSTRAML